MSNQLSVIGRDRFTALAELTGDLAEARRAQEETGEMITAKDLIRVKTPAGGSTTWEVGPNSTKEIQGLLVCYQPRGVLWPSDDPAPGTMPVLSTLEPLNPNAVAEQVGPIPSDMLPVLEKFRIDERHFRWSDLPYNQWGSGRAGAGKRCKEQREMFILPVDALYPLRIVAQPGSVKSVSAFFKSLIQIAGVPYYRCFISLTLVSRQNKAGKPYAEIVPKLLSTVDAETGAMILKNYTTPLKEIAKSMDVSGETPEGTED